VTLKDNMTLCDRCKSSFLQTKPYRKDYFSGPEGSFEIKTKIENLCEDCSKTTARESDPGLRRSKEAQELLKGKGDLTEDEEEE
jgi:hypothetical protein